MLKILIVLSLIFIDRATKLLADNSFIPGDNLDIFPGLALTLSYNTGAAFSFLANESGWQRWLFVGISALVSIVIIFWLRKIPKHNKWDQVALCLILAGAVGNVWDRLVYGYVIDFIKLYYQQWYWPIFNVADMAICVGAFMVIFSKSDKKN